MNFYFMAAFSILMFGIAGCASSSFHQNTSSIAVERNPASEIQITNRQDVYLVMAQILKSLKAGKARQSCVAADFPALNAIGIYVKSLSVAKIKDEVLVYPIFNEKGDASQAELGYGMCFIGPISEWSNILK